jgi:3-hydroxybutyryl-CoA dehydrogenase
VFEAGPENLAIKQDLFAAIEAAAPREAILASNTSVIPITQIMARLARRTGARDALVEPALPRAARRSHQDRLDLDCEAVRAMTELLTGAGKTPVTVEKDVPGFVGNRLQHALWREAIALVANGVCDAKTVDTVVKASFGRRLAVLGPLENADLVGTDLTLAIHRTVLPILIARRAHSPISRSSSPTASSA